MAERWSEIVQVSERIDIGESEKKRITDEISYLNVKLQNVEAELQNLHAQKLSLAKEVYGDPSIRKELVESGKTCSNYRVRQAARQLKENDTNVKWDDDFKLELINLCIFIDRGTTKMNNWNIKGLISYIGKLGIDNPSNY